MQAVVLLLDASPGLRPVGGGALLPLGPQKLIDATLGWLERSGLCEVYLVTASHADQLSAHLKQAGWASGRGGMAVHVMAAHSCQTEGEALRFVEEQDVIKGDFLLVGGAMAANVDLRPALQAHMARRAANRQAIMTIVLHSRATRSAAAAAAPSDDGCLAVVDPSNQQLLRMEQRMHVGHAALGTHLLGERNCIAVRGDLRLSGVYVCAPDILVLLSDNFDYQSVASDLVPGILSEQELGSTLHIHELGRGYIEQARTIAEYAGVNTDVLGRWAYPWVPDNSGDEQDSCRFNRGAYVDASASVAPGSTISKGSLVGRGSTVEAGARLDRCAVGGDCHIGRGAVLQSSCLHAHVRVDDGCQVASALLADHVVVRSHAKLEAGVVLAKRVVIDTAHTVPAGTTVSLAQQSQGGSTGSDEETDWPGADGGTSAAVEAAATALAAGGIPEVSIAFDEDVVGSFGAGFAWHGPADERLLAQQVTHDGDSEAGDFMQDASTVDDAGHDDQGIPVDQFKREVAETFLRCIKERISHDNAVIELNGLKIAEDRTFADCARYMLTTMLGLCLTASSCVKPEYHPLYAETQPDTGSKEGRLELLRKVNMQLKAWKDLLHRFLKSNDDQVELLLTLEEYCAEEGDFSGEQGAVFAPLFPQVIKLCYDHDLLTEEAILDWAHEKEHAGSEDRRFVNMCADLLAWLEDAEEESSDASE